MFYLLWHSISNKDRIITLMSTYVIKWKALIRSLLTQTRTCFNEDHRAAARSKMDIVVTARACNLRQTVRVVTFCVRRPLRKQLALPLASVNMFKIPLRHILLTYYYYRFASLALLIFCCCRRIATVYS